MIKKLTKQQRHYARKKAADYEGFMKENRNKTRAYIAKMKASNPEEWKRKEKERYKKMKETDPEFSAKNRERRRLYVAKIKATDPDKFKQGTLQCKRNRRARLVASGGSVKTYEWEAILEQYNNRCAYCGTGGKLTMDHVIPLSRGGLHKVENLAPACRSCNAEKFVSLDWNPKVFPKLNNRRRAV